MPLPVDQKTKCFLYWIHLPEHTDIFTQGYVGITTKTVEERFKRHKAAAKSLKKDYAIKKAIRKHGDELIVDTILIGTLEYCSDIEYKLRPKKGIGYNSSVGGISQGIMARRMYKADESVKYKISQGVKKAYASDPSIIERQNSKKRGKPWTEERHDKMKGAHSKRKSWQNSMANPYYWLLADKFYKYLQENPEHGYVLMARHFNFEPQKLQAIFNRIRKGWNPNSCPDWQEFHAANITKYII